MNYTTGSTELEVLKSDKLYFRMMIRIVHSKIGAGQTTRLTRIVQGVPPEVGDKLLACGRQFIVTPVNYRYGIVSWPQSLSDKYSLDIYLTPLSSGETCADFIDSDWQITETRSARSALADGSIRSFYLVRW